MSLHAKGTFDVKAEKVTADSAAFPRFALHKQFRGELEGTSEGEMMTIESPVKGSGGYVAIEKVAATLAGRKGSFALLHNGTMKHGGNFQLDVKVIPDSGTDELTGLTGTMKIIIDGKGHSYEFEYSLPN